MATRNSKQIFYPFYGDSFRNGVRYRKMYMYLTPELFGIEEKGSSEFSCGNGQMRNILSTLSFVNIDILRPIHANCQTHLACQYKIEYSRYQRNES